MSLRILISPAIPLSAQTWCLRNPRPAGSRDDRADESQLLNPNYAYRAYWDAERESYFAGCLEFKQLFAWAWTAHDAVAAVEKLVEQELGYLEQAEMPTPEPLTDRIFSGRFVVRTSRAMHASLIVEAAEQGVSLNQWVMSKLAGRRPPTLDELFFD